MFPGLNKTALTKAARVVKLTMQGLQVHNSAVTHAPMGGSQQLHTDYPRPDGEGARPTGHVSIFLEAKDTNMSFQKNFVSLLTCDKQKEYG